MILEHAEKEEEKMDTAESQKVELTVKDLPFQANEALNTLRANIMLSGYGVKVVCLTSSFKHEGKSSLSFRLAMSFAALDKKTVFLDCDIRNSRTIGRYKVQGKTSGLSTYLCNDMPLLDVIYHTTNEHLDIIFAGDVAPNPSELFSGSRFNEMLQELKNRYDYVIVDTPPVNAVIDGVLIAKQCDGTVLVVESGVTDRVQAQRAKQQLDYAGVKILGVALNKLGTKKSGYGYGYGYGYGRYGYGHYGYGEGYGYGKKK